MQYGLTKYLKQEANYTQPGRVQLASRCERGMSYLAALPAEQMPDDDNVPRYVVESCSMLLNFWLTLSQFVRICDYATAVVQHMALIL